MRLGAGEQLRCSPGIVHDTPLVALLSMDTDVSCFVRSRGELPRIHLVERAAARGVQVVSSVEFITHRPFLYSRK